MRILTYLSTSILLVGSVLVSAAAEIVTLNDSLQLFRRAESKKRSGARSVPPNGRTPLSRETKYEEAKKLAAIDPMPLLREIKKQLPRPKRSKRRQAKPREAEIPTDVDLAAMDLIPKLGRSKSLPNRPNPVFSNVITKEKQIGLAREELKSAKDALQPDFVNQIGIWNDHIRGKTSPTAAYKTLQAIGQRQQAVEPLYHKLTDAYTSAGKASMDAGLTHRTMRNNLKAGSARATSQLDRDENRLFNNGLTGNMLPAVALERAILRGPRHDPVYDQYMKKAAAARSRAAERAATVRRGEAKVTELRRTGGQDSESEGYDSEKSNIP